MLDMIIRQMYWPLRLDFYMGKDVDRLPRQEESRGEREGRGG